MANLTFEEYQRAAVRTAKPLSEYHERVERGLTGLMSEVGELAQLRKKSRYQGHPHLWTTDRIIGEMGDILWYLAVMAQDLDLGLDTIARINIDKLRERFPDGFDADRSVHRNVR